MTTDEVESLLVEAGLEEQGVTKLVEEYKQMQTKFQNGDYSAVGMHSGRFCEGIRHVLRFELDNEYRSDDSVREFAMELFDRQDEGDYSTAIYQHLSNMLHTAWDIRSNRDAAHMNLETAVNKADAKLSVALCSSMLVELIREFAAGDDSIDADRMTDVIEELSVPIEENPLRRLVTSEYEFDSAALADTLDGLISIVEEEDEEEVVNPGPEFHDLRAKQQVVALALGQLAAHDLGVLPEDEIAQRVNWFQDRIKNNSAGDYLDNTSYIEEEYAEYWIPGYQVENAIAELG
jgi:hypothetical protein